MPVIVCEDDSEFTKTMVEAGTTPIVTKFSATWCGPCKMIAPFFNDLSLRNPALKFVEVDVDKCEASKNKFGIAAMPTFVVIINGQKMDMLRGADRNALDALVTKWAANIPTAHESPVPGQVDLMYLFDPNGIECLNEDSEKTLSRLLDGEGTLASDCDEQLIINLPFTTPVRVHSIQIEGPAGKAPKNVKVFANVPHTMDFDKAQGSEPIQILDFGQKSLLGLKFVKFQNVNNIQLFVENNCEDGELTVINNLRVFGQPVSGTTNMNEFKRVAGKAGESSH